MGYVTTVQFLGAEHTRLRALCRTLPHLAAFVTALRRCLTPTPTRLQRWHGPATGTATRTTAVVAIVFNPIEPFFALTFFLAHLSAPLLVATTTRCSATVPTRIVPDSVHRRSTPASRNRRR